MKRYNVKPKLTSRDSYFLSERDRPEEFVYIGKLSESGQPVKVYLDIESPRVSAIFGKRGSGKSFTLGSILEGLSTSKANGSISNGSRRQGAILFDTLGIFQWMDTSLDGEFASRELENQKGLLKGWDVSVEQLDVSIFSPRGFSSLNPKHQELVVNIHDLELDDIAYLLQMNLVQDTLGQLLSDLFLKVSLEGWNDGNKQIAPSEDYSESDLTRCLEGDLDIQRIYHPESRRALLQRMKSLFRIPFLVFKGPRLGDQLNTMLRAGHLSIIAVHKLTQDLRYVLIVTLLRRIMRDRILGSEKAKSLLAEGLSEEEVQSKTKDSIPPCWVVIDEAQNFLPSERSTSATETVVRMVREGRNYGISFALTTQQPSAIDSRILAQVDTIISHKLTVQADIDCVRRNLKTAQPTSASFGGDDLSFDNLMRSLDTGQAVVTSTDSGRLFLFEVRPRISVHGGFSV